MDMRPYSGQHYIKTDDVRDAPFRGIIGTVKNGRYGKPDLVFESGETLSLNATNTAALIRSFGPNSVDWYSKIVECTLGQTMFQGDATDTVIVKPISPPIPLEQQTPLSADDNAPFN